MLQLSQYFELKHLDFILIIFSLISLIIFIQLIIRAIKNRNQDSLETENTDKINLDLPSKNPPLLEKKRILSKIINISLYKILPCLFVFVLLFQTINLLFPALLNSIFPSDSQQTITITNDKEISQSIILLGRMSYSNDWIPIFSFNNSLQFAPIKTFSPSKKIIYNIRTGVGDIDYIIVANLTDNKLNSGIDALVFSVPCNDVAVFTKTMGKLNAKPNIYFGGILNYLLLYFTAIFGIVALFLILFFKIYYNKKLVEIIFLSLLSFILFGLFIYIFYLNFKTLLVLI